MDKRFYQLLGRVLFSLCLALLLAGVGGRAIAQSPTAPQLRLLQSDTSRVVVELSVPSYNARQQTIDGATYTVLSLPDFGHNDTAGAPQLPTRGTLIGLPARAEPSLRVLADDATSAALAFPPLPGATAQVQSDPIQVLPTYVGKKYLPDAATYSADRFFPSEAVQLRSVGNWRSQRYALLQFTPLQYNPSSRQLLVHRYLRVEITFNYPNGKSPESLGAPLDEGSFESVMQRSVLNYDSAKNWRARDTTLSQPPQISSVALSGGPWYKIAVASDGIYQVTCQQLADAGINPATLDASTLKIFKQGVELAIQVVGAWTGTCNAGDYLLFFAQAANTRYTTTNIYWLTFGGAPGKRMTERNGSGAGATSSTFSDTLHVEPDRIFLLTPALPNGSDWFWSLVSATNSPSTGFNVDGLATGATSATLQAKMFGYSFGSHETLIYLNDQLLDDTTWSGQVERVATVTFPQSLLSPITNTLRISEALALPDFVYFNNFDVGYARTFTATNDVLRFRQTANGAWQYQVTGFSAPSIAAFDSSDPYYVTRIVGATVTPAGGTYTLGFADASPAPREYLVLADTQRKTPSSITADTPSNLASASNGADYIVIASSGFVTNVQPLAAYRAAQGMRVKLVDVQDVYDEFSDGLMDAQAIHDFLQTAYANWQAPAPSFVLLVGDGNYDFKNNLGYGQPNFIPPYLLKVDPWLGETASDNRLVAFGLTNALPSMAIGRLPADSAADVDAMVSKILNYEQNPPLGDWRKKVEFVTDNVYDQNGNFDAAGNFWALSDLIASDPNYLPPIIKAERIYFNPCNPNVYPWCALPYTPAYTTDVSVRNGIVNAINDGRVIVNYIGHSGFTAWASNPVLFRVSDVNTLANGDRLPVMLAMTCYDGYFHHPLIASIAETNVRLAGRGALASWSASGLGVATGHDYLDRGFFDAVMNGHVLQLGPAAVAGKLNLWLNNGGSNLDLIDTFNLLGDPASRLAVQPSALYLPLVTR